MPYRTTQDLPDGVKNNLPAPRSRPFRETLNMAGKIVDGPSGNQEDVLKR
jgi:cation transport regulator ChaB